MSKKDLILWQPGQSGNPKGRPKGTKNFKTLFRELLDKDVETWNPIEKKEVRMTVQEIMALKMVMRVVKDGDLAAFQHIEAELGESILKNNPDNKETKIVIIYPPNHSKSESKSEEKTSSRVEVELPT